MEFGKARKLKEIDFSLAPLDSRNSYHHKDKDFKIHLGAPAWGCDAWRGKLYPLRCKPQDYLYHYSRELNAIELNSTFYGIPRSEITKRWISRIPSEFRFCPKVPRQISHEALPASATGWKSSLNKYCDFVSELGHHAGPSFLQLSPEFSPNSLVHLEAFLKSWPKDFQLQIELRHPNFFSNRHLITRVYDLFREHQVGCVITDVAGKRELSHASLPNSCLFVRFIGNDLHETDFSRIKSWISRISDYRQEGLTEVFFFIHEPDDVHAPELLNFFCNHWSDVFSEDLGFLKTSHHHRPEKQLQLFN